MATSWLRTAPPRIGPPRWPAANWPASNWPVRIRPVQILKVHFRRTAGQYPRQFAPAGAPAGPRLLEPLDHRVQDFQGAPVRQLDLDFSETDIGSVAGPKWTFLAGQEVASGNGVFVYLSQRSSVGCSQLGPPANTRQVGYGFERTAEGNGLHELSGLGMNLFELVVTAL